MEMVSTLIIINPQDEKLTTLFNGNSIGKVSSTRQPNSDEEVANNY
jgi:hypothetical protein